MKFSRTNALRAVSVVALSASVDAFWRMPCKGRTALARIDPLVNFGEIGEHVHSVHGSSGFSATSTSDDLLAGDCTSCQVTQDKSAYWIPALYFKKANGEFEIVKQVGGILAYYLLEPKTEKLTAFPKGFELLAGDTYQRNFTWPVPDVEKSLWSGELNSQAFLRQWALGFNCLNYKAPAEASLNRHFLPDKGFLDGQCTEGVRLEIMFPSCWDGKNLAGINGDKKSHMAYPALGNTGACPEGFPVRTPTLFYESIWDTYAFKGQDGQFVFANGDPTGYGFHADFITGWDEPFLQSAIDTCTNLSGKIEDCPLFNIQSESDMDSCQVSSASKDKVSVASAAFKEEVETDLKSLPGNVLIKAGPAYAQGGKEAEVDEPIPTSLVPSQDVPKLQPDATKSGYLPGQALQETGAVYPPYYPESSTSDVPTTPVQIQAVVETPAPTPAPVAPVEDGPQPSFIKTETKTNGQEVVHIYWVEEVVTVTATYGPGPETYSSSSASDIEPVDTVHVTQTAYVNPGEKRKARRRHIHNHHKRAN